MSHGVTAYGDMTPFLCLLHTYIITERGYLDGGVWTCSYEGLYSPAFNDVYSRMQPSYSIDKHNDDLTG